MNPSTVRTLNHATTVRIFADTPSLVEAAAREIVACAVDAIAQHGRFDAALAGGSTPRGVYSLLAAAHAGVLPWQKVHLFFGDERHVGPDDPQSNYRMVRETLLSNPALHPVVHRIEAERPASEAAKLYEDEIRKHFATPLGTVPRFDLILLGMGTDGHTASLFPNTAALQEKRRAVVANEVPQLNTTRITLTFPVLNHARNVIFLTAGADKAAVLARVLNEAPETDAYPSQLVKPVEGRLLWMVDAPAAKAWLK